AQVGIDEPSCMKIAIEPDKGLLRQNVMRVAVWRWRPSDNDKRLLAQIPPGAGLRDYKRRGTEDGSIDIAIEDLAIHFRRAVTDNMNFDLRVGFRHQRQNVRQ